MKVSHTRLLVSHRFLKLIVATSKKIINKINVENVKRKAAHFWLSSVAQERRIRKLPHSSKEPDLVVLDFFHFWSFIFKPGFHIVVSVVRKKFIGQIQLYGNLPYNCSIQKKPQIQLVLRDRMNSICPMNFFSYDRHDRYDRYNDMETRL